MNQNDKTALTLADFGTAELRVERAVAQIRAGGGVIVVDDEDRENEGDIIYAAETISPQQMNLLIRAGSGIVCLVLTEERTRVLDLPPMVDPEHRPLRHALHRLDRGEEGVTTGVSAADRVTTIRTAIADDCKPSDLARPGHVFPLKAHPGGVLGRTRPYRGHDRADAAGGREAGRRAVRSDERGWHHGTPARTDGVRAASCHADRDDRRPGRLYGAARGGLNRSVDIVTRRA
jgi:3,4-dihydroxy 2-butanone 4-phosphate synthase